MSEEQGGGAEAARRLAAQLGGRVAVVRVDPIIAEENLFQKLQQQVTPTKEVAKTLKELSDVEGGPQTVMALVHVLLRQVVASPLGHIVPPEMGAGIVKDRIVQAATSLLEVLKDMVRNVEAEIEKSLREGRDYEVEQNVRKMIAMHHFALIAIREVMNRYLVLYSINLPPELRPPLAHIKLGMEVIKAGG